MLSIYSIYNCAHVNKFEARSIFSTSHLKQSLIESSTMSATRRTYLCESSKLLIILKSIEKVADY